MGELIEQLSALDPSWPVVIPYSYLTAEPQIEVGGEGASSLVWISPTPPPPDNDEPFGNWVSY